MSIQDELHIRNENIQHVFNWFCDGLFMVNRKYQRKLVWTLQEKEKFIESIALNYPVPLFLLARAEKKGKTYYEIIDGMQRLDALFSFIRGEFPIFVNGEKGFFDLETMAKTKELLDKGELSIRTPVLKRELCTKLSNYQLPISITSFDDNHIEEIFRRINATGRQLSDQDLRQAGATGAFSDLVRKLANQIRRDSSPEDVLELSKMKEISLSNVQLSYGINLNEVFWVKQEIISVGNMRISRDEELIAYILTYILLGKDVTPSAKNLNVIYGYEEDGDNHLVTKILTEIEKHGEEKLIKSFMVVFDEIEKVLRIAQQNFNELLFNQRGEGKPRSFQVIFLAMHRLLTCGKEISNYEKLVQVLNGLGNRSLNKISESRWNAAYRHELVKSICGIIESCFIDTSQQDPAIDMWVSKLENLLMQSKIEQQLFDFKIGLHSLESSATFNSECLKKIVKTLTAMANTGKNTKGYVLVGIADGEQDYKQFSKIYGKDCVVFNDFYITGVESEIQKYYRNADDYFNKVKQLIGLEPIEDYTKSYILRFMRLVNYFDRSILVFSIKSTDHPLLYDNVFFERHGANVEQIEGTNLLKLMDRFK